MALMLGHEWQHIYKHIYTAVLVKPCAPVCRDGSGYGSGGGYGGGGFSAGDYAADSSLVILDDVNFHEVTAVLGSDASAVALLLLLAAP
jgi:hypothetical protein